MIIIIVIIKNWFLFIIVKYTKIFYILNFIHEILYYNINLKNQFQFIFLVKTQY